jgi:hypothetical protein
VKTVSRITTLQNRKNRLYVALLLTVLLGVFSYGFRNDATSLDDDGLVFENPVQLAFGLQELRDAFDPRVPRTAFGFQFTPLSDLSYAIDRIGDCSETAPSRITCRARCSMPLPRAPCSRC